ncbi:hypothetical protein GUITHDRAFT_154154 [Guillardia theta CCMP2712]|uniref:MalT-like TPR region domain-containing protein n=1 Tax=Guillardia theta (strain CCMP2712) TaxID=905079 RepID=L1IVS1_GUITC|nr:hypothetical protein GUITHDRAFT_154154 [Guillardia theta CCMP2712]EKX40321.1 hypothetical protein GUITHDRAFT_154154 [Guillardia theta CCMP2712]|eukprot:XP_005827301.1 hypothetical protein GUITHDRAFT_154154 [Guillardia theta CCMP2712]
MSELNRLISDVYQRQLTELDKAEQAGMKAEEQEAKFGLSSDDLVAMGTFLTQFGKFLSKTGQNLACIKVLKQLVGVQEKFPKKSLELSSAAYKVANQCWKIGYHQEALEFAKRSMQVSQELLGHDSVQVADAFQLLSLVHFGLNDLPEAEKYMLMALKLREQLQGREHAQVAEVLLHLGAIALRKGNADDAREYQLRANRLMGARSRRMTKSKHEDDKTG